MKEVVALVGILLALFTRTVMPYWRKRIKAFDRGKRIWWDHKYTVTFVFALIMNSIVVVKITSALILPNDPINLLFLFFTAFAYGWGFNDAANKIFIDWFR